MARNSASTGMTSRLPAAKSFVRTLFVRPSSPPCFAVITRRVYYIGVCTYLPILYVGIWTTETVDSAGKKTIFNLFVIRFSVDAAKTTMAGRKTLCKVPLSASSVSLGGKRLRRDIIIIIIIVPSAYHCCYRVLVLPGWPAASQNNYYETRTE